MIKNNSYYFTKRKKAHAKDILTKHTPVAFFPAHLDYYTPPSQLQQLVTPFLPFQLIPQETTGASVVLDFYVKRPEEHKKT